MTTFKNLTPHDIVIVVDGGNITIPPSGTVARCQESVVVVGNIGGVPIVQKTFGAPENLPTAEEGTIYIVSALVGVAARREDVMSPGEPVRDAGGRIVGCKALCAF